MVILLCLVTMVLFFAYRRLGDMNQPVVNALGLMQVDAKNFYLTHKGHLHVVHPKCWGVLVK